MDVKSVADVAELLLTICGLLAAVYGVMSWSHRQLEKKIAREIREATYPISAAANGGLSLPDVARRTEAIERELIELRGQVDLLVRIYTEES